MQYSPGLPFLLLKVGVSSGTRGTTRIFPSSPSFAASVDCPFDSTRIVRVYLESVFGFLAAGLPSM